MLYGVFVFFMIMLSAMGIIHMITFQTYTYIIFPISTLIWGLYKYFKDNDDEYCRRNGIKNSADLGWLLGIEDDDAYYNRYYGQYGNGDYYNGRHNYSGKIRTNVPPTTVYHYKDPEYKKILPRCRRNSLVTTDKVKIK